MDLMKRLLQKIDAEKTRKEHILNLVAGSETELGKLTSEALSRYFCNLVIEANDRLKTIESWTEDKIYSEIERMDEWRKGQQRISKQPETGLTLTEVRNLLGSFKDIITKGTIERYRKEHKPGEPITSQEFNELQKEEMLPVYNKIKSAFDKWVKDKHPEWSGYSMGVDPSVFKKGDIDLLLIEGIE